MKNLKAYGAGFGVILAIFAVLVTHKTVMAQTTETGSQALNSAIPNALNDLINPLKGLGDQIQSKLPQVDESSGNAPKNFLNEHGFTNEWFKQVASTVVNYFTNLTGAVNSSTFIFWLVDIIRRFVMLAIEFASKVISML